MSHYDEDYHEDRDHFFCDECEEWFHEDEGYCPSCGDCCDDEA